MPIIQIPSFDLKGSFSWTKDESQGLLPIFPTCDNRDCDLRPHELFEKFFDNEVMEHICKCSNLYATKNNMRVERMTIDGT